jgi:hypothetical protein
LSACAAERWQQRQVTIDCMPTILTSNSFQAPFGRAINERIRLNGHLSYYVSHDASFLWKIQRIEQLT